MKALGLVVSEKIFLCFPHDAPGAGPVWTPGARMAGFMKRTTRHCYTQYMKALGLVVSEKKIFICFSHCKSMGAICCHGNQSSDPTLPKTFLIQPFPLLNDALDKIWSRLAVLS